MSITAKEHSGIVRTLQDLQCPAADTVPEKPVPRVPPRLIEEPDDKSNRHGRLGKPVEGLRPERPGKHVSQQPTGRSAWTA